MKKIDFSESLIRPSRHNQSFDKYRRNKNYPNWELQVIISDDRLGDCAKYLINKLVFNEKIKKYGHSKKISLAYEELFENNYLKLYLKNNGRFVWSVSEYNFVPCEFGCPLILVESYKRLIELRYLGKEVKDNGDVVWSVLNDNFIDRTCH